MNLLPLTVIATGRAGRDRPCEMISLRIVIRR
jgi:hypothetical protein